MLHLVRQSGLSSPHGQIENAYPAGSGKRTLSAQHSFRGSESQRERRELHHSICFPFLEVPSSFPEFRLFCRTENHFRRAEGRTEERSEEAPQPCYHRRPLLIKLKVFRPSSLNLSSLQVLLLCCVALHLPSQTSPAIQFPLLLLPTSKPFPNVLHCSGAIIISSEKGPFITPLHWRKDD